MKIIRDLEHFVEHKPVVLTQGTFDGVHLGHQKIITHVVKKAREIDGVSVLLTFYPHPRLVLFPDDNQLKMLSTIDEKAQLLESFGLDYLVILPFTKEISRISAYQFIKDILVEKLHISTIIVGYDHRFGKNREGSIVEIKKFSHQFNYQIDQIAEQDINDCIVSSTKIRNALLDGNIPHANELLGRTFGIRGIVIEGNKLGKTLGFPTANVEISDTYKLIPMNGVYAVRVNVLAKTYNGMANIGTRPTLNLKTRSIEVHIFNFNDNIYGQELEILFVKRWRNEIKFETVKLLQHQLKADAAEITTFFEHFESK
ncbi:MAG: bifunctional riboflavin kinase/FAD synthetase [Flavobacteriales bacterium]|nr:bifunctional riboflavin kinase/FAD synthetase [Flavobacteriales bacterium]